MISDFDRPIRLGIVGCGAVAQHCHLPALAALPQFEVRYLCDKSLTVAQTTKARFGLPSRTTNQLKDMSGEVDAAIVCVWPRDHLPVTCELLAMNIDVLCEKPAATSSIEVSAMVQAARDADRIVAIGQWCRFQKNVWILRKALSLDLIGDIQEIEAVFGSKLSWPMSSGAYFNRSITPGGVMFDAGIHLIDLIVWLFGRIEKVRFEDDSFGGTEANGILFGNVRINDLEVPCRIAASWTHELRNGIRVVGNRGQAESLFLQSDEVRLRLLRGTEYFRMQMTADNLELPFCSSNPYEAQLENFATAVRSRCKPVASVESTIVPLEIIESAYSARQQIPQPWVQSSSDAS